MLTACQLAAQLAERAVALSLDVVLVNRLEVLLARGHKRVVGKFRQLVDHTGDHLAHAVFDEPRTRMGTGDDRRLSLRFINS